MKKYVRRSETYLLLAIFLLALIVQFRSGQFFTGNNIIDLIRALIVPAMFCIIEMLVLVSGGTDVSFPAIASLSMFVVSTRMANYNGSVFGMLAVGALLGLLMGAVNGFLIGYFNFSALIVTLGTSSLFFGIMYGPFAAQEYPAPPQMIKLGKSKLFTVVNPKSGLKSDMPVAIIFLIVLLILVWFILKKTMLGRGIYAIGGDITAAQRAGFNVFGIQMFIYCFAGLVAGFTGVLRCSMLQNVNPTNLEGIEMTVIAACVLGGASVLGGKGSLFGVMLGISLITIMENSLILMGIPTYWQRVFTGLIILIGTGATSYQEFKRQRQIVANNPKEVTDNATA